MLKNIIKIDSFFFLQMIILDSQLSKNRKEQLVMSEVLNEIETNRDREIFNTEEGSRHVEITVK